MSGVGMGMGLHVTRRAEGTAFVAGTAVIKGTADDQVKLPGGANAVCVGIAVEKGDAADVKYETPPVCVDGPVEGIAGAAIVPGALLKVAGATGRLTTIGGEGAGTVVEVVGRAIGPAAADGDPVAIVFAPYKFSVPV